MRDEEILTKPLSNWQPEDDKQARKLLAKLVEECGELIEEMGRQSAKIQSAAADIVALENELADVHAMLTSCRKRWTGVRKVGSIDPLPLSVVRSDVWHGVIQMTGMLLVPVARCQMQGLHSLRHDSEDTTNIEWLMFVMEAWLLLFANAIPTLGLDMHRIDKRSRAKVLAKTPWFDDTMEVR